MAKSHVDNLWANHLGSLQGLSRSDSATLRSPLNRSPNITGIRREAHKPGRAVSSVCARVT